MPLRLASNVVCRIENLYLRTQINDCSTYLGFSEKIRTTSEGGKSRVYRNGADLSLPVEGHARVRARLVAANAAVDIVCIFAKFMHANRVRADLRHVSQIIYCQRRMNSERVLILSRQWNRRTCGT